MPNNRGMARLKKREEFETEYKQKSKRGVDKCSSVGQSARYVTNELQMRFALFREQRQVHLKWLGECWGEVRNHFPKTQLRKSDAGGSEKASDACCHYSIFPISSVVETCVFCNCIFSALSHSKLQVEHTKGEHSVQVFSLSSYGKVESQPL